MQSAIKKIVGRANRTVAPTKRSFPVYMEEDILEELDKLCEKAQMSRNAFIVDVCKELIAENHRVSDRKVVKAPIPTRRRKS